MEKILSLKLEGRYEEAIELIRDKLSLETQNGELYHHLAQCHDALGYEEEAIRYYNDALRLGVHDQIKKDTLICLASSYNVIEQYDQALDVIAQAEEEFPGYPPIPLFKSLILFSLNREGEALQSVMQEWLRDTDNLAIQKYKRALLYYSDQLTRPL